MDAESERDRRADLRCRLAGAGCEVARARLLDACFAVRGRIVSPGAVIGGRAASQPRRPGPSSPIRADSPGDSPSAIDAQGRLFRFRSVVEDRSSGRIVFDGFDAGEVDDEGRITVLLTFGGTSP